MTLGPDELLIRVEASSVNHGDAVARGQDFAGVVEARGARAYSNLYEGTRVFGFCAGGAWDGHVVTLDDFRVARLPDGLSFAEGAAAGRAGCAALMCVEVLKVKAGDRVLVLGAAGGVGSFVVQLCALKRAHVVAPCLLEDRAYLVGLGAAEVPERGAVVDCDAVVHLAGPLPSNPRAVSLVDGLNRVYVETDRYGPFKLAPWLRFRGLRVPIHRTFGFDEVDAGLVALGSHKQGKLSVV